MGKHLTPNEKKNKKIKYKPEYVEDTLLDDEEIKPVQKKKHSEFSSIVYIIFSTLLLIVIPICPIEGWMIAAAYGIALLICALELIFDVLNKLSSKDYFAPENIVILASLFSFAGGAMPESVLVLILFRITKLLYIYLENQSLEKIKGFFAINPDKAKVESAEGTLEVLSDFVNVGDIIQVEAGESIPLDGIIVEGISTIDTSTVSGQSSPWAVNEGYRVYSGCRNITSPLRIKVSRPHNRSTASCLVSLVESSCSYHSRQENLSEKVRRYFPLTMIVASVLLYTIISMIDGQWHHNLKIAATLLTAASFSIILSSLGACYAKGTGLIAESGIFVKGFDCIESLAKAETMVFDKTGIVTEGRYIITDVFPNKVSEHELLTMAATAERLSRHPIAVAFREAVGPVEIDCRALQIEELPGRGISAFVGEKQVYVGNASLLEEHGIKCAVPVRPGAAIHVAVDYKYWGHIMITDRIRRGAFDALENLRAQGVKKMVLLTGDVLSVAKPLASKLNFDMLRAELKPGEKISAVDYLMTNRGESSTLAFVGDGNSDEKIMSGVDVAIAMGALGSDAAINNADILIMDRDIKKLPVAYRLSKHIYNVAMINFLAWFILNGLILILGAMGLLPLIVVIIAEFLLALAVFLNTQRIK